MLLVLESLFPTCRVVVPSISTLPFKPAINPFPTHVSCVSLLEEAWSIYLLSDLDLGNFQCGQILSQPTSAKINISYSILFNLTTSYSSYFGGKKGISRNK